MGHVDAKYVEKGDKSFLKAAGKWLQHLHLLLAVLYACLFVPAVCIWALMTKRFTTLLVLSRDNYAGRTNVNTTQWTSWNFDQVLYLWIGACVFMVVHFVVWLIWESKWAKTSLRRMFVLRYQVSPRWFFFWILDVFYILVEFGSEQFVDAYYFTEFLIASVVVTSLFATHDIANHAYLLESVNRRPIVLHGVTREEDDKRIHNTNYCHFSFFIPYMYLIYQVIMNMVRLYYSINYSLYYWAFTICNSTITSFFFLIVPLVAVFTFYRPSKASHITTTMFFHFMMWITYVAMVMIVLIGQYATY